MKFRKATKEQARLRAALFGPSGAGKTYTSLLVARGLGGRVALIDTERGTASKYADRFEFDVLDLDKRTITMYCAAIEAAAADGYETLIIDSLSHAWQELLVEVDQLAKARYKGNTWSAWSEGTPKQKQLVEALLNYPGHVIATMRSKTEWTTETENGKSRPVRVGLAPEQGKGIEYEFDLLLELSVDHVGAVLKDRTGKFQDAIIDKPGEAFGAELRAWLGEGTKPLELRDVLVAIAEANDDDALTAASALVQKLRGDDKAKAVAAGKKRRKELQDQAEAERMAMEHARRTQDAAAEESF